MLSVAQVLSQTSKSLAPGAHQQKPLSPILCLSRVDLIIERLSGEVSHAHSSKTQSKQS